MLDAPTLTLMRVDRLVAQRLVPAIETETRGVDVSAWTVGGEPVPFAEAVEAPFTSTSVGTAWGAPWDTVWFKIAGTVPSAWAGGRVELEVDLGFDDAMPGFQAEGTAWTADGTIIKGVEPRNSWVPIDAAADFVVFVEAAANPNIAGPLDFAPTSLGDRAAAGGAPLYRLRRLELVLRDDTVEQLVHDISTLRQLVVELPSGGARTAQILRGLSRMVDAIDPDDIAGSASAARATLQPLLSAPAPESAHRIAAVGHAHIDSAWLWPTRETVRKVTRTFSNVVDLMRRDPDFVFAASSAQQYAWLKEHQPELFERVRAAVAEGRFIPVGGMWVESDTNMPSGESLVRQFVQGSRFFEREFGVRSRTVWLPDSFGYSAAFPQIAKAAGMRWMLTQKMSWNETNRMPHHSFFWEGIDGSRLFTHFPPQDTYNGTLSAAELAMTERQHADKARSNRSLAPFGWGDGGGGPTREMLAAAARAADLDGSPRVEHAPPEAFFAEAEQEADPGAVWVGEMYLELHRGTLTSQARTKRGNRRSEALLAEAELWCASASVMCGVDYPHDRLDTLWRSVLLHQFHDILPGSSIGWVHREAETEYGRIEAELESIIDEALGHLVGSGDLDVVADGLTGSVTPLGGSAPGSGWVSPRFVDGRFEFESAEARAAVDRRGVLTSLVHRPSDREVIPDGAAAGVLQLFRDTPRQWDAWDIDEEDKAGGRDLLAVESVGLAEDGGGVVVRRVDGASTYEQTIRMDARSGAVVFEFDIDWREREKLLKLAFPLDVHAERASSEIQYGHISRPIHRNTSWDVARFETVAHRWTHVGEPDFGVALLNDSVYGHDIRMSAFAGGGSGVVNRLSLLRAPLYPDPQADQGRHRFTVAVLAGVGVERAGREARRLQVPVRSIRGGAMTETRPLVSIEGDGVTVTAVKLADDRSGDVIVRLHEAVGGRATAVLSPSFPWLDAQIVDVFEDATGHAPPTVSDGAITLTLRPFALRTVRIRRDGPVDRPTN